MIKLLVLGTGRLSGYIQKLAPQFDFEVECVSLRKTDPKDIQWNHSIIIDTLDPASSNLINSERIKAKISSIREKAASKPSGKYIYISSAKVYVPNTDIIDEKSNIMPINSNRVENYVSNKINWENWLTRNSKSDNLYILRVVSLWDFFPDVSRNSFFDDLILSRLTGRELSKTVGDEKVISYMNYLHASSNILKLISSNNLTAGICNITADCWASRASLKMNRLLKTDQKSSGLRVQSRIKGDYGIFPSKLSSLL